MRLTIVIALSLEFAASARSVEPSRIQEAFEKLSPAALYNSRLLDVDLSPYLDGKLDATALIQSLLDGAGKKGGQIQLPPGRFLIGGRLAIPEGVTLRGSWGGSQHYNSTRLNSVLMLTAGRDDEASAPAMTLTHSSGLVGFTIVHPEQRFPEVKPYPWTISGDGFAIHIENIVFVNAYNGIRLGNKESSLHLVRNIWGWALRRGLQIDNCWDIGRVENVHFNPTYFSRNDMGLTPAEGLPNMDQVIANHGRKNLEAFIIGKTDWGSFKDCFVYGARIGYRFIDTKNMGFNGKLEGIGADGCETCLQVESTNPMGILITNGMFVSHPGFVESKEFVYDWKNDLDNPNQIVTRPGSTTPLILTNCSFWGGSERIALLQGTGLVSFNQCLFRDWDGREDGTPAIDAEDGKLSVIQCQFQADGSRPRRHVRIGGKVRSAQLIANDSEGPLQVENQAGERASIQWNDKSPSNLSADAKNKRSLVEQIKE